MARFRFGTLTAAIVALLALPASAGATTFGADLQKHSANSNATCGYPPFYPGILPLGDSCTFFSTATPSGNSTEGQVVPLPDPAVYGDQSGTINTVRIKTGPGTSGPAQLTILRAERPFNGDEVTCCTGVAQSAPFTLVPNSIVTVTVNLPVVSSYDAAHHTYAYDTLALTVLNPTTRIPAEISLDLNGYCSTGFLPYILVGQERLSGAYNVCGFLLLMQSDLTVNNTGNGGGGGGGGKPAAVPAPRVQTIEFPALQPAIAGRIARVRIKCAGKAACKGVLRLQNQPAGGATTTRSKTARKTVTYGKGSFRIAAGRRQVVRVKLNSRGKRLIVRARRAGRKKVHLYANATLGSRVFSKKLRLKTR